MIHFVCIYPMHHLEAVLFPVGMAAFMPFLFCWGRACKDVGFLIQIPIPSLLPREVPFSVPFCFFHYFFMLNPTCFSQVYYRPQFWNYFDFPLFVSINEVIKTIPKS